MTRKLRLSLAIAMAVSAFPGCVSDDLEAFSPEQIGQTVVIRGEVTRVDARAMPRDGDGIVRVTTSEGDRIEVLIPARIPLALKESGTAFRRLTKGDRIEAAGVIVRGNAIRISEAEHYLKRVGGEGAEGAEGAEPAAAERRQTTGTTLTTLTTTARAPIRRPSPTVFDPPPPSAQR
ncbi:MAG: hypothetical protein OER90_09780 [Gemmatimonadota bacterium]|nr:hypothetical protein [Gemmatimonadota bacterium]